MDSSAGPERAEKPWDHPWTTDEMREKRTAWNLAGDAGLLQHLQQFSDKLMTTANKTQEALNSFSSELDETIIFIDNITNTSLALANTQFIESRVYEDEIEAEPPKEQQLEVPKTKEQLDAELIASIGETVRRGIAIMEEKYEILEVIASDSEDEGETAIPSVILRPKDPYQDRPLPYIIGSEKWKNSTKIGLETSSSDSDHQEEGESESDSGDDTAVVSKQINVHKPRIARLSSSSSESNDFNAMNNTVQNIDDRGSYDNQDIFGSENETSTTANSVPKNSISGAPNFAEELAKRLGSVIPPQKSINTQVIEEPVTTQPEDDLFTQEDEDLFGAPSKNLFSEPTSLFSEKSRNSLWDNKLDDPLQSSIIPSSLDVPPPISAVATKPKSAIDDLFGDADSEDSDNLFSSKLSTSKLFKQQNSPTNSLRTEGKPKSKNLLSVSRITEKTGMATSTPETNDMVNSLFGDEPEDEGNIFSGESNRNDWIAAKKSVPDKSTGSTPAEASNTSSKKKPVGGVSILGQIDIFASGKLRRQPSSESCSSQSSSDFETQRSRATNTRNDANSVINNDSSNGSSVMISRNMQSGESSGISLQPPSVDDVTAGSNISPNFQPAMTSTWNKTGDMYRERIASDSLFAAKTLSRDNENSLNNARIEEAPDPAEVQSSDIFLETDEIFGPPPLPEAGSKTERKSKVASLFDDFDSDDDLFSNTSSGSRSQKSADLLTTTTTSRPSDKLNIFKNRGLFDDDEKETADELGSDIFGGKVSANSNLFASKVVEEVSVSSRKDEEKSEQVSSSTVVQQKSFSSSVGKQSTNKETPQTAPAANIGSIFDDLDDDDLFAPNFGKKISKSQRKMAPSLFDDGAEDLFAAPSKTASKFDQGDSKASSVKKTEASSETAVKSGANIGGQIKSKVMEQLAAKLDLAKTVEKTDVESKSGSEATVAGGNVERTINTEEEHSTLSKHDGDGISSKNKSKNLATKILNEIKTVQKSKLLEADAKPEIAKKPAVLKKLNQRSDVAASKSAEIRSEIIEETRTVTEGSWVKSFESETRVSSSEEERSSTTSKSDNIYTEQETSSTSFKSEEISSIEEKREPPKTLEIRSGEKPNTVQRRVVSGKIKNLMGRMSDLKILSPTDSPPAWRKNEDRVEEESDKDTADGSCSSTSRHNPTPTLPADEPSKPVALLLPTDQKEIEPAISFDQPVQVETLSVAASKSRVRIQTKRRPQSRHARQNALRKSGIDFDSVDFAIDNNSETNRNLSSNSENNNPSMTENSANFENIVNSNNDRLIISRGMSENVSVRVTESSSSTFLDDRSEISFSKESTLSMNKNTLLSPSTDEEDLFDVPPDLPEDPPKEDNLFGRAPILSPVESFGKVQKTAKHETSKSENRTHSQKGETTVFSDQFESSSNQVVTTESSCIDTKKEDVKKWETPITGKEVRADKNTSIRDEELSGKANLRDKSQERQDSGIESKAESRGVGKRDEKKEELTDPLRDGNHDPLKDPSNLFPFVTKTPSPEKGKNLLFDDDDDGLFSNCSSKKPEHGKLRVTDKSKTTTSTAKKQSLDIFAEDSETDFFTTALPKSVRKPHQESKIDLFADDDNQDDDLFGGATKKLTNKASATSSRIVTTEENITKTESSSKSQSIFGEIGKENTSGSQKTTGAKVRSETKKGGTTSGIFSDDDSAEIFTAGINTKPVEGIPTGKKIVKDIFGDQSSGDEDMFAAKKSVIKKPTTSSGLFDDDDNEGGEDIFGKSTTSYVSRSESVEKRGAIKRTGTRDLRKTAEQIVEDPLSILQKD
ncbi:WASH complex subunit 2C isoform X1 [Neodiprion fabricii]|uniref:WASH complex subunit 2C isoform X1 n=1 Tax=Neodiprion fabricii TaxID=2872261 RepID=UPI001ED94D55|nr:WASH complex subunit 2C isoform X1 [Neodiprion fabricii]